MEPAPSEETAEHPGQRPLPSIRDSLPLALAALGVVYGDIGTSPLYAVRECFKPQMGGMATAPDQVLSVLSLIFWALTLVIVVKYLSVVLRADNRGEGGILALLALLIRDDRTGEASPPKSRQVLVYSLLGIFGTSLLLADGMITPSISVLSAVEGLEVAAPHLADLVVPLTVCILIGLFVVQRFGTARIARFFGPIMFVWFATIGCLGLIWIRVHPEILAAVDPRHILRLFLAEPAKGFLLLGAIVLCITGAEALYADMGHFGRRPIRLAWYLVAFPALLLNYFGQGAYILAHDGQLVQLNDQGVPEFVNLFYAMVPQALLYPTLLIATLATVIASQALISGAFSLAQQAVQLGFSPRLTIIHTSGRLAGQIYVPFMNWSLMIACILLVVTFKESSSLAGAYGIAVIGTMLITSILVYQVMRSCWHWSFISATALLTLFLLVDLPFFLSNLTKVVSSGWIPLVVGCALFVLMTTWQRGQEILNDPRSPKSFRFPLELYVREIEQTKPNRDQETVVFLTAAVDMVPNVLLEMVQRTHHLAGRLVILSVRSRPVPRVRDEDAVEVRNYGQNCFGVTAWHGFMQRADMTRFLALCKSRGLDLDPKRVLYYLSRMTLAPTGQTGLSTWRKGLFMFLYNNAGTAVTHFNLPPDQVVELGRVIEI